MGPCFKLLQDRPRMSREAPTIALRWLQERPRALQELPKRPTRNNVSASRREGDKTLCFFDPCPLGLPRAPPRPPGEPQGEERN
eukprot:1008144-Pyramimonas_sp.AAC.1